MHSALASVATLGILPELTFADDGDTTETLVVDPSDFQLGGYSTISAAVAAASSSGARIVVRPGTYVERVTITKSLVLAADPGAILQWSSDKPYEAALTIDLASASAAANILVSGLSIRHSSPSIAQNYATFVPQLSAKADADSRIELRYCDVSSSSGSGVGIEGGVVTLTGCRVHDCKNHGVLYLGNTARGAMRNCDISLNKLNGLLLRDGAAPIVEGNRFINNGQYGASLIDCRAQYLANDERGNAKGAIKGECDDFGDDL